MRFTVSAMCVAAVCCGVSRCGLAPPRPAELMGVYAMHCEWGVDTLVLGAAGAYEERCVLNGRVGIAKDRWEIRHGRVVLLNPLQTYVVEPMPAALGARFSGWRYLSLDMWRLNQSLSDGEDGQKYVRVSGGG